MIYGRRFFDRGGPRPAPPQRSDRRGFNPFRLVYRSFQMKYTLYLLAAVAGSVFIFNLPAWYFVHENYQIFNSLAYDLDPSLVEHLEREVLWLGFFAFFALISTAFFCLWIGFQMTGAVVGPLISLERHMKQATLGDWRRDDFQIRDSDDFRSLANTYSYFYRTLRAQAENEIQLLEKIYISPEQKEAYTALKSLVAAKRAQLGVVGLENLISDEDPQTSRLPKAS